MYCIYQCNVLWFLLTMQERKALGKVEWRKILLIESILPHLMLLYSRWCCKSRNSHFALLPHLHSYAIATSDCMLCTLSFKIYFCSTFLNPSCFVSLCHWHAPACAFLRVNCSRKSSNSHLNKIEYILVLIRCSRWSKTYISSKTLAFLLYRLVVCRYVCISAYVEAKGDSKVVQDHHLFTSREARGRV